MMKRLKVTLFASLMVLGVSLSAFANEAQPINVAPAETIQQFTDADMQLVFEQDTQPMQLAALSQTEMKETEGAWLPIAVTFGPIAFRLAQHGAHHAFRWIGSQPHLQLNMWRVGVSGSGRTIFRIPTRWW